MWTPAENWGNPKPVEYLNELFPSKTKLAEIDSYKYKTKTNTTLAQSIPPRGKKLPDLQLFSGTSRFYDSDQFEKSKNTFNKCRT